MALVPQHPYLFSGTIADNILLGRPETSREEVVAAARLVVTMVLPTSDGRVLKIRRATKPEPQHLELYTKLNVPPEPIKPKKTRLKQG